VPENAQFAGVRGGQVERREPEGEIRALVVG
jgi:hypothetical protein